EEGRPVWAQTKAVGAIETGNIAPGSIEIPYDLARTQEVFSKSDDVIIHIQDAHASLAAQHSIAGLLDSLVTNYNLSVIALEGATGYVDTSVLKTFPDKDIKNSTAEFLMREGHMSAGEFFAITHDSSEVSLYGIENDDLYKANVESFRRVAEERALEIQEVNKLAGEIETIAAKACSKDLIALNRSASLHREGRLSFVDHWAFLGKLSGQKGADVSGYKELSKLLESIELEKGINFAKANLERKELVDRLSSEFDKKQLEELVLKSLSFKQNKMSQADFHTYLLKAAEDNGVSTEAYANMRAFTKYVKLYESVDLISLYREVEAFENFLREKLYRNDEERRLVRMARMCQMIKQLYAMELTEHEARYVRDNMDEIDAASCVSFIQESCKKYGLPISGNYNIAAIRKGADDALVFYADAEARNEAMIANTLKVMRREGKHVAALVTGGYHTGGLTELMKRNQLSYLVVVPKFEAGKERPYVAILTNKKKPYEELLDPARYQLAVEAYFHAAKGDPAKMKSAVFYALGEAAIAGKNVDAIKNIWIQSYEDRYKAIVEPRIGEMDHTPVSPAEFRNMIAREVSVEKVGDTAVIAQTTSKGVVFVSLVKRGSSLEFVRTTKPQEEIYLARHGRKGEALKSEEAVEFADALKAIREKMSDIDSIISTYMDRSRQGVTERLNDPTFVESFRSNMLAREVKLESATENQIVTELRRMDVNLDVFTAEERTVLLASFIAKVKGAASDTRLSPVKVTPDGERKVLYETTVDRVETAEVLSAAEKEAMVDILKDIMAASEPTLKTLGGARVQIVANSDALAEMNTAGNVIEIDIKMLKAVNDAALPGSKYTKDEYTRAAAWFLNHEVRHASLMSADPEVEELAIITRDIEDFLILPRNVQGAILWIMSPRNKNGVDTRNFNAVLRRARAKVKRLRVGRINQIWDKIKETKRVAGEELPSGLPFREVEEILKEHPDVIKDEAALREVWDKKGIVSVKDARKIAVSMVVPVNNYLSRTRGFSPASPFKRITADSLEDAMKLAAQDDDLPYRERIERGEMSMEDINVAPITRGVAKDALGKTFVVATGAFQGDPVRAETKESVIGLLDQLTEKEAKTRIEFAAATNREVLEALGVDISASGPEYLRSIAVSTRISVDELKDRVRLIDAMGYNIYGQGSGISLLARSSAKLNEMLGEQIQAGKKDDEGEAEVVPETPSVPAVPETETPSVPVVPETPVISETPASEEPVEATIPEPPAATPSAPAA
ncbi:MAG: hypothetical protein PHT95_05625, partial [Candidatus Omnitrophica bacterium]|nr:hypothetical protein [Candidatus Omnitrophota bacterium]